MTPLGPHSPMRPRKANHGFTIIELLFVVVIGAVLTGLAFQGLSGVQDRLASRGAKGAYQSMHNRAKARAVASGETVLIVVYTNTDEVAFFTASQGVHDRVDFGEDFNVDIQTSGPSTNFSYYQCMTPMGYADTNCGSLESAGLTPISVDFRISFVQGEDSMGFTVLPLGQLIG